MLFLAEATRSDSFQVAVRYKFEIIVCNYAGCRSTEVGHDTTNWNCGPEDDHKVCLLLYAFHTSPILCILIFSMTLETDASTGLVVNSSM